VIHQIAIPLLVLFLLIGNSQAQPALTVELQNRISPIGYASRVVMALHAQSWHWMQAAENQCELSLEIELRISDATGTVLYEAEYTEIITRTEAECFRGTGQPQVVLEKTIAAEPGTYKLESLITDKSGNKAHTVQEISIYTGQQNQPLLSDISLYWSANTTHLQPWLGLLPPQAATEIILSVDCKLPVRKPYRVRAMLFQQENPEADELADRYQIVYQQTQSTENVNTQQQTEFRFSLKDLKPADYLIEVFLLDEQGVVHERRHPIRIPWNRYNEIYQEVPRSIDQLQAICPAETYRDMLSLPAGSSVQSDAFTRFWTARSPVQTEQSISHYYQQVFQADSLFREGSVAGYHTDRGIAFLQLGMPSEQQAFLASGERYLIWKYRSLNHQLVFHSENQTWKLIPLH